MVAGGNAVVETAAVVVGSGVVTGAEVVVIRLPVKGLRVPGGRRVI